MTGTEFPETMTRHAMDIVIRGPNWLGDTVLACVVLDYLHHRLPHARLHVWAPPRLLPLYHLRRARSKAPTRWDTRFYALPDPRRLEAVLLTAASMRRTGSRAALLLAPSLRAALETTLGHLPIRVGYPDDHRRVLLTHAPRRAIPVRTRWTPPFAQHVLDEWLDLAGHLVDAVGFRDNRRRSRWATPAFDPIRAFRQTLAAHDPAWVTNQARHRTSGVPRIALAPFVGSGTSRAWPLPRYLTLARRLVTELGAQVTILGGPADRLEPSDLARCRLLPDGGCRMFLGPNHLPLDRVAAILANADLLVTNDSGLMHLGAALGTPLVGLFGPTRPHLTGPYVPTDRRGVRHRFLQRHDLICLGCYRKRCPSDHACLEGIDVDEVFSAVRDSLETPERSGHTIHIGGPETG